MNRKHRIIISIVGIFIVLLALMGLTYGYYLTQINDNDAERSIEIATANLEMVYSDGTADVNASGISPIYPDEVLSRGLVKSFIVGKTSTSDDIYAKIKLIDLSVSSALASYDVKWALYRGTTPISTGDFGGKTSGEIVLATNELINTTNGNTYNLYIWINETGLDQSSMINQTLSGTLDIVGYGSPEKTLASVILGNNNANVITTAPNFTSSPTDKGLYVQQGDVTKSEMGFPTYYYRGNVTNNYVKFGESCDYGVCDLGPIIWRIVRINEDGSIRLISENSTKYTSQFDSNGTSNYTDTLVGSPEQITAFYDLYSTMGKYSGGYNSLLDNKVVISSFCNDNISYINEVVGGTNYGRFGGYDENNSGPRPIFVCPNGANNIYSKYGMITADEAIFAGSHMVFQGPPNTDNPSYLVWDASITGNQFWTLTAAGSNSVFHAGDRSMVYSSVATQTYYNRVVINLSADVVISGGDGLSGSPYTIR